MSEFKLNLRKFDMSKLRSDSVIVMIAKRNSGKSVLCKDILYHHRAIPCGMVISPTEKANKYYSNFIPDSFVYDDYELSNLGGKHPYLEPKETIEHFGGKIFYYISDRVDGAQYVTDCIVESQLTTEELNSVEYSDSMVRFLVERHLTSIGICGNIVGIYKNGKPKFRKPKVVHRSRAVLKKDMNKYKNSAKVSFLELKLEEVLDEISTPRP